MATRAIFTYGRFNPPTMGHDVLVNKLKSIASGDPVFVFTSQSNDPNRNPFDYKTKTKIMKKAFRGVTVVDSPKIRNMFDAIELLGKKYDEIVMVVGSDRVQSISRSAVKSAAKMGIKMSVQSAGERDPDAEGSKGMSASKMRAAAARDDYSAFMKGCPASLSKKDCLSMFKDLKSAMGITESWFDNDDFNMFCEQFLSEPQILDRLVQQLKDRGVEKNRAFAIATSQLQKAGVLKKGTQDLTKKGEKRQEMGAAGRAKDRAAKKDGNKPSDYKYNSRTNIATLKDSTMNEEKKPLIRWMDAFEKELKKRGGSYKSVDPVDALKMYYKGVDPKKAAAQLKESRSQFDVDASPMIRKYIEQGKGIVASANSTLGGNSKFVVMKRPTAMGRAGQDQFMMATISDPKRGRIKMFSYHGTHPSKDGAMKMAKSRKLAESVELEEKKDPRMSIVSKKVTKLEDKERDLLASAINMSGGSAGAPMANRANLDRFNDGVIIPAMTFLRKNMSSLTPEGKKLGKTILKVLGEAVELDEATQHIMHVNVSRTGFRKLEAMIASLDGYRESDYSDGKARFYFDAKKHDSAEHKKVKEFIKKTRGAVQIDENIVSDKLYRASHGKKPNPNETGGWYFGFSTHSDDIVYQSPNKMKYKDAKKEAEKVAKEKGHKKIYVMASYDPELSEMKLTPKKMAFSLGQKAHMSGKRREPIKDNRLKALLKTVDDSKTRNAMNKEWLRGWDQQNLKDDVQFNESISFEFPSEEAAEKFMKEISQGGLGTSRHSGDGKVSTTTNSGRTDTPTMAHRDIARLMKRHGGKFVRSNEGPRVSKVFEAFADRKVVSTPSLGSLNAPSSNFRMNLPPTGKMKKQMQQIMKKDASYRRKMSNLVQKSETQKDGTITLHFSSARKRTSFQKLLHQGIKEGLCEAVDKDDTKFAKKLVKNLRKGSKTHAKQADDLEKAINDERDYKKEYQNYHSKPEQRLNRSKRVLARRKMIKSGRAEKGDGKDVDHKDGNPQNNSPSNLRMMSVAQNRSRNNNKNENAGEEGTNNLVDKYRNDTPGQ